ncbi:MAG: NUDIX domain-containing protein [Spirochaetales bacterium]|nr:NUDIX domain-containing protein [Spirochaetales bacterium]
MINPIKHFLWSLYYKNDEWFDILDPDGKVIGEAPRTVCHRAPGLLHPVVHLQLTGPGNTLYLQKRSMRKKIQPGKWDTAVGGHLDRGEMVETGLRREALEELGISGFMPTFLSTYIWECPAESEMVNSFSTFWDGPINTDPAEIEEGRFWHFEEIDENLGKGIFTPNFEYEYRMLSSELKHLIIR